jgi:alpha-glucosidase
VPLFRPLLLNYQSDYNTLTIDDQFMIGADLLVAPVVQPGLTSRRVYLPEGTWIDYWTGKMITGGSVISADAPLETVPMYVRAGAIIPMGPEMNYVGEKRFDPVTFSIYPDAKGEAATTLYEDDGESPAYKQGVFRRTNVSVSKSGNGFQVKVSAPEGSYNPGARNFVFVVKSAPGARLVSLDGKPLAMVKPEESKGGWYKTADGISVRIADNGKAHQIQIR